VSIVFICGELLTAQSDRVVLASIDDDADSPIQVKDYVERQKLKQIEDSVIDISIILDSTLDTVNTLLERYQANRRQEHSNIDTNEHFNVDDIEIGLLEKRRDVLLFCAKVGAIRSKVQSTIKLVC
jgi:hypothetical protein